jgi:CheY-like chemotaxis protein
MVGDHGVLVVDDSADLRESVVELLRQAGYPVLGLSGAEAAATLLEQGVRPCLILLDLNMPGDKGGMWFLERVRDQPLLYDGHIIVFTATASATLPAVERCELLRKPAPVDELLDAVSRHCRRDDHDAAERGA